MSTKDEHLKQAGHNFEFYQSIDSKKYSDWAVTALYYSALQFVDAFLAKHRITPGQHDQRDQHMNLHPELKAIAIHYFKLKSASRTARYYPSSAFSDRDIRELENLRYDVLKTHLLRYIQAA